MLLEKIGKIFISKMRPLFFFLLILLPLIFTGLHIVRKRAEISDLKNRYERTLIKAHKSLEKKDLKEKFLLQHSAADPYFLDQKIESLPLLQNEINWLIACQKHPAIPNKKMIKERLDYLCEKNKISFIEEEIRTGKGYKETDEKMKKGVELDETDLKKLLCLVENVPIGTLEPVEKSPQLIITNFHIKKNKAPFERETFEVKMNLLKREFN